MRKHTLLRLVAILLLIATALPILVACKKEEEPPYNPDAAPLDDTGYTPVIRFAVASDLHMREEVNGFDYNTRNQLDALYKTAYAFSDSQIYTRLDGVFVVGDYSQNGHVENEVQDYFNYIKENTREGTVSKSILGNHEFYYTQTNEPGHYDDRYSDASIAGTYENYLKYSGCDSVDAHLVIGGYHFIYLAMDLYKKDIGEYYSTKQLAWLKTELQAAAAEDPTGKKPIFVFQHVGPSGAALGGSDKNLNAVLSDFPQVVDFYGHSHHPLSDPRSIHQNQFTMLNTGSLAYLGVPIAGHSSYNSGGVRPIDLRGSWATGDIENAIRTGGMYYIVEVDANNVLRVLIYDIFTNSLFGDPIYIDSVGDPNKFDFTSSRKSSSKKPGFEAGATVSEVAIYHTSAMLTFPQATKGDTPQNYCCDVYEGTSRIKRLYRLSCSFLGDGMPATLDLPITKLKPNTEYTVKIAPVNNWGKAGDPISYTFKTKSQPTTPVADILSLTFNDDGSAVNSATGATLFTTGTPTVAYDAKLGKNVATFDGKSAYRFNLYDYLPLMEGGFSVEAYFRVDSLVSENQSYSDVLGSMENGGFGLEVRNNGDLMFLLHNGTKYSTASTSVSAGTWIHVVCVFDGTHARLYVNGMLKKSAALNRGDAATMQLPSAPARYLCIGGDANGGVGQNFLTGRIATVNMYSEALSADEVMALYTPYN